MVTQPTRDELHDSLAELWEWMRQRTATSNEETLSRHTLCVSLEPRVSSVSLLFIS